MSDWLIVPTPPLTARSETSRPSPESIWCAADSRARTSHQPVSARGSTALAQVSGGRCGAFFATYDRKSSCWRTSQLSLLGGQTPYLGRWPKSGTMLNGRASEQTTWALPIAESGGFAWPTPTAGDAKSSGGRAYVTTGATHGGTSLCDATERWATPTASDYKGSTTTDQRRGQLTSQTEPGTTGRLNPAWVELLMGFPAGWTDTHGRRRAELPSTRTSRPESSSTTGADGSR